jgi:RNA polymerase sigma-70 factor (ECF subfamily)
LEAISKNNPVKSISGAEELHKEICEDPLMITQLQSHLQDAPTEELVSLIHGCKRQDRESQRLFYSRYYGFALKVVYRYMGDYTAAIRLTNEAMVQVFRSFPGFKILEHMALKSSFGRWLKDVFIQAVVGWSRSQDWDGVPAAVPVADADIWAPAAADNTADAQLYRILITRLVSLPLSQRLVFNLYVIDGYSAGEVAKLSGMRVKRVERCLSEARSMLHSALGN